MTVPGSPTPIPADSWHSGILRPPEARPRRARLPPGRRSQCRHQERSVVLPIHQPRQPHNHEDPQGGYRCRQAHCHGEGPRALRPAGRGPAYGHSPAGRSRPGRTVGAVIVAIAGLIASMLARGHRPLDGRRRHQRLRTTAVTESRHRPRALLPLTEPDDRPGTHHGHRRTERHRGHTLPPRQPGRLHAGGHAERLPPDRRSRPGLLHPVPLPDPGRSRRHLDLSRQVPVRTTDHDTARGRGCAACGGCGQVSGRDRRRHRRRQPRGASAGALPSPESAHFGAAGRVREQPLPQERNISRKVLLRPVGEFLGAA